MPIIKRKALHGDIGASLNYITQDNKSVQTTVELPLPRKKWKWSVENSIRIQMIRMIE